VSIVTLPCSLEGYRAVSFDVIGVYRDRVFLVDLSAKWNGYASVVDAAEDVCRYCDARFGPKRVISCDDMERWHEIIRENGAFTIAPYRETFPLKVISYMSMHSGG
jgi:hypothetical protein